LCQRLTGKDTPTWINRAASIGVALPCVVPQAWGSVAAPTADDADGELVEAEDETEATGLLRSRPEGRQRDLAAEESDDDDESLNHGMTRPTDVPRPHRSPLPVKNRNGSKVEAVSNQDSPGAAT